MRYNRTGTSSHSSETARQVLMAPAFAAGLFVIWIPILAIPGCLLAFVFLGRGY
jgi:hypothetical protein